MDGQPFSLGSSAVPASYAVMATLPYLLVQVSGALARSPSRSSRGATPRDCLLISSNQSMLRPTSTNARYRSTGHENRDTPR